VNERLCGLQELANGQAIECALPGADDGSSLVVLSSAGNVHAYLNSCPHTGRPLNWAPGRFLYAHGQLVCAAHGASFVPETGYCIGGPCRGESLTRVAVTVVDDEVRLVDRALI